MIEYRKLVASDDPILHKRVEAFDFVGNDAKKVSELLKKALVYHRGLGLAANQIGLPYRAFAMMVWEKPTVFFNPIITELDPDTVAMTEMCLSFPGKEICIKRPKTCRLNYSDENNVRHTRLLDGIEARCALHEVDHLNGIVFTSKTAVRRPFSILSNSI
jgi:peptide deformylase